MTTFYSTFESPVGPLLLMSDGISLVGLHTDNDKHRPTVQSSWVHDDSVTLFAQAVAQAEVAAALVSAIWPAESAVRTSLVEALEYE